MANARDMEHGVGTISAGIPYSFPYGHWDDDVPTSWLLLYGSRRAQDLGLGY